MEYTNTKYRFDLVMLIDDDPGDNYINNRVIKEASFSKDIITMSTAEDALHYLLNNSGTINARPLPQIIFLDLNLGKMSGHDFLNEFRKFDGAVRKHCKIVVLSDFYLHDPRSLSGNSHVSQYLEKPLDRRKLELIS